ncbi:MAG: diguanylate cyclase [Methyloversatilis sp.]|nr:diguanylate cyclase [Methyloversatilis sp.]
MLSTHAAGPRERRLVSLVITFSLLLFAVSVPYAKMPMPHVPAFIAIYDSALFIIYLVTAILLYGHGVTLRSRAIFLLADGFLYAAAMIAPHLLTYPDVFSAEGLLGANAQTTAWIFQFWHVGFPLCVIGYSLTMPKEFSEGRVIHSIFGSAGRHVSCALLMAVLSTLVAIHGTNLLPDIMMDTFGYTRRMFWIVSAVWILNGAALYVLWRKTPRAALDLWLIVTMVAWLLEVALVAVFNSGRYDLGFYVGRIHGLLAASMVLVALVIENGRLYAHLGRAHEKVKLKASELERVNATDALTGIASRRVFGETLGREWQRSLRSGRPLSLLMLDVDHFKPYNDMHGHLGGDDCLRNVAQALASSTRRASDLVARYGGEEFAILLPDTGESDASAVAQSACRAVLALGIPHGGSTAHDCVTVSIGVATFVPPPAFVGKLAGQPSSLIDAADQALYEAKQQGRNRVVVQVQPVSYHTSGFTR